MNTNIYKIFQDLNEQSPTNDDRYAIAPLPSIKYHKIGISHNGQPMFFIKCDDNTTSKSLDVNLEFISILYNRKCQLTNKQGNTEEDIYTIISLKSDSYYLNEYFIKIVFILLKNISETPLLKDLKIEIDKLINLFTKFSKPALKTIQGLWAELLIIEQSKNPDYIIQSWHSSPLDKYDFNDGIDKIEVKSTAYNRRIHNFSLEQLTPNSGSKLIIASIFTIETGTGTTIFDLVQSIENKIRDKNLAFRINEMIALTLGEDFKKSIDIFFDYQFAIDSILFYNSSDIPLINQSNIPSNIINIRFDCDLSNLKPYDKRGGKSELHDSLF